MTNPRFLSVPLRRMVGSLENGAWGDEPAGDGQEVLCIRAADFDYNRLRVVAGRAPMRSLTAATRRRLGLVPGDIVLEKSGGGEHLPVGRAVMFDLPQQAVCSNFAARLRPVATVEPRYLTYVLASHFSEGATARCIKQTTGIQNLDTDEWLKTPTPCPGIDDQGRIADFLDHQVSRIDQVVATRLSQIRLANERYLVRWGESAEACFTQGPVVPLRRVLVSITDGPFGSSLTSAHYAADGTRVIRLGDIGRGRFRPSSKAYILNSYGVTLRQHAVQPGDLVVAGLGDETWPLGRAAVVPADMGPAIVKADCYRLRLNAAVGHDFVAWVMSSPRAGEQMRFLSRGATRARLNTDVVREVSIPLVPRSQQRAAVAQWQAESLRQDALVIQLEESVALLLERKRALITAAVTGELDVSAASGRGVA